MQDMKIIVIIAGTTRILFRYQFFDKEGIIVMIWKPTKEVEQVVQESEGLWVDSQALLVARPCKFPWPRYWNPKLLLVNMLAYARQPLPLVFECVHEKVNVTSVAEQFERSVDWKKFYRDLSYSVLSSLTGGNSTYSVLVYYTALCVVCMMRVGRLIVFQSLHHRNMYSRWEIKRPERGALGNSSCNFSMLRCTIF